MNASVTVLKPKDPTAPERSRRYRRKRKAAVTAAVPSGVTAGTVEMAALAGRLAAGTVMHDDLRVAGRLVLALMTSLPPNGEIDLGIDP
jgi:hypothetical protein